MVGDVGSLMGCCYIASPRTNTPGGRNSQLDGLSSPPLDSSVSRLSGNNRVPTIELDKGVTFGSSVV